MSKKGGFPGEMSGLGNMQNLMKQAQNMQKELEKKSQELEDTEFEGVSGGGMVKIKMNGKRHVISVKIDKEAVDPDDVEILEDLIVAAINDVNKSIDSKTASTMGGLTGGLGLGL